MAEKFPFVGIDGCPAGWFYVAIDDDGAYRFDVLKQFSDVDRLLPAASLILVDIPIGLPSSAYTHRVCDKEARQMIKPRGSSVFPAPARSALSKKTYTEGSAENFRVLGRKLSRQSWGIAPKIREVDEFMRTRRPGSKIREMHPEVAFWALNDRKPLDFPKKEPEGREERFLILQNHWPHAKELLCEATINLLGAKVEIDDVLDALAGAVTASKLPHLATLPLDPPLDEENLPMEIVHWRNP